MRVRFVSCWLLVFGLIGGALAQGAPPRRHAPSSCERSRSEVVIQSVSARAEFALVSGRTVRLLDIRVPVENESFAKPLAWLQSLVGRKVMVAAVAGGPDRWGRVVADLALLDEPAPIDLADLLVGEGYVLADVGDRTVLCRPDLLIREKGAREGRLGLWGTGDFAFVPAEDMDRLRALLGRYAVVQGVVRSVGERRERTYLNFGARWTDDFTITIPKRTWAMMRERGLTSTNLRGKRVRARGILDEWQGVAMEITAPDMLEFVGQEHTRP
jgi:endonuclease YncB( thermonuclease family)